MGLLPEVNRRQLYEKKGCQSIFEFAKKLAGLSEEQVRRVLNLEKSFEDKPVLKNILVNGEVSVNKLTRIASIATKENEEILAEQVKLLPQKALETLVQDERIQKKLIKNFDEPKNKNGLQKQFFEDVSVRAHRCESRNEPDMGGQPGAKQKQNIGLQLSEDVQQKLLELQQKGIDINQLILEMLQKRELEIAQEKEQLAKNIYTGAAEKPSTRYIPIKIKKLIQKEHGTKCSIPTCQKPAEQIHHTQRFALAHTHDPHYLAPLCGNHHIIAHSIDQKFHRKRVSPPPIIKT